MKKNKRKDPTLFLLLLFPIAIIGLIGFLFNIPKRDQLILRQEAALKRISEEVTLLNPRHPANQAPDLSLPECCPFNPWPYPKRIAVSHNEGTSHIPNFATNYSTIDILFAPDFRPGSFLPMVDFWGHRFDDNGYAASLGFVGRYIPACSAEILGINLYGDYRQGFRGHYYQIGIGVEILGPCWDFRGNGYIPLGPKMNTDICVFDDFIGDFFAINRKQEFVAYGFNAEVGYSGIRTCSFLLYLAAGPYYLTGKVHPKTRGVKARMRPQYRDYLALDLSYTYDSIFRSVYQAELIISIPLYQITSNDCRKAPCGLSDRQVYQPVERFEVIPLGRRSCWESNF